MYMDIYFNREKVNNFSKISNNLKIFLSLEKIVSHEKIPQIHIFSNNVFLENLRKYVIIFTLIEIC